MSVRLKYKFNLIEIDDDKIAVPLGDNAADFHSVLNLNPTGAAIFELLMQGEDEAAIVAKLSERYGNDPQIPAYVHGFLEELIKGGVLV